jgi:hypothetical protein
VRPLVDCQVVLCSVVLYAAQEAKQFFEGRLPSVGNALAILGLGTVPPRIVSVSLLPISLAVGTQTAVVGIFGDLLSVVLGTPAALALSRTADYLIRMINGVPESLVAIGAHSWCHTP